jgi:putative MATE family efflux protein
MNAKDMTIGSPLSNLVVFSIPLLIGNFIQQLYNAVDSIVVGNYIGDNALAAVGASISVINMLVVLFMGIAMGTNVMISQYFGAKQYDMLSKCVGTSICVALISAVSVSVIGVLITSPVITLIHTPPEIYTQSCQYLYIIFIGIIGPAFYNILAGILRGLGDSGTPLVYLIVACLVNIALDIVFVAIFGWGVAGVAVATIIAQMLSAALCLLRLLRMKDILMINRKTLRIDSALLKTLMKIGIPSGLQQTFIALSGIFVQSLTNSFGTAVIAANVIVMRIDGFAMMPNMTFGIAMTTYTGQNIGAKKTDRVRQGVRTGIWFGIAVSAALTVGILVFSRSLANMFTSTTYVSDMSVRFLRILATGYVALSVTQVLSGIMRGAGNSVMPMCIALIAIVFIRVPLAYLLAFLSRTESLPGGSPESVFIALLVAWLLSAVISIAVFKFTRWRNDVVEISKSIYE